MRHALRAICVLALAPCAVDAADLRPETAKAFDEYVAKAEARIRSQVTSGFLCADNRSKREQLRAASEPISEPRAGKGETPVTGGLIHDWVGAVYIPAARVDRVLAIVQDYDSHKESYKPEVLDSRLISRSGDDFKVYLRLFKKKVISVVLNTEHSVHYEQLSPDRWWSRSISTRIAQVNDPGSPSEKELAPGRDQGFLWRLNSYWTFQELDGGTYVECEAISLARDIPRGLGWIIAPIIRELPRQSLANTLAATRKAVLRNDRSPSSSPR